MKNFVRLGPLIFLACVGCGAFSPSYYEHSATRKFNDGWQPRLSTNEFDVNPQNVDSGIFFLPDVGRLARLDRKEATVGLYAKNRRKIEIERIVISAKGGKYSAARDLNRTMEIKSFQNDSHLYRGSIAAFFEGVAGADEVLSNRTVILTLHYKISKGGGLKERQFELKKTVRLSKFIKEILAAA